MTDKTQLFDIAKQVLDDSKSVLLYTKINRKDVIKRLVYFSVKEPVLINVCPVTENVISIVVTHVNRAKDLECKYHLTVTETQFNLTAYSSNITATNINTQVIFQNKIDELVNDFVDEIMALHKLGDGLKYTKPHIATYQ